MPPNRFESEVESFLEGSHGDRTHIKRADHHTVTPLCGTLLPGRCVCPWAAAFLLVVACGPAGVPGTAWHVLWAGLLCVPVGGGPPASRTRREPSARRVVSKPGQAPPPPTGTAAWPSNPSRCPPHQWGLCCCELLGQAPPPPTGPAPRPSGPSSGVRVLDRKFCCG